MSKYSKKIIAGGCSFTDKRQPLTLGYKHNTWPEFVGELLGMEVINLGQCGSGNRQIKYRVFNEIMKYDPKDIGYVFVGWTEWTRLDYETSTRYTPMQMEETGIYNGDYYWTYGPGVGRNQIPTSRFKEMINVKTNDPSQDFLRFPIFEHLAKQSLQYYYDIQNLCKDLNIPYYCFQAIATLPCLEFEEEWRYMRETSSKLLMEEKISALIDEKCFWGWPIEKFIGGDTMVEWCKKKNGVQSWFNIKGNDRHPSEKSHRLWAEQWCEYVNS